jgi:hypothetical protein
MIAPPPSRRKLFLLSPATPNGKPLPIFGAGEAPFPQGLKGTWPTFM